MDKSKITAREELLEEIDELEEFIERLYISSNISYDEDYHNEVVKLYRDVMSKIKDSPLENDDKEFLVAFIAGVFEENKNK